MKHLVWLLHHNQAYICFRLGVNNKYPFPTFFLFFLAFWNEAPHTHICLSSLFQVFIYETQVK